MRVICLWVVCALLAGRSGSLGVHHVKTYVTLHLRFHTFIRHVAPCAIWARAAALAAGGRAQCRGLVMCASPGAAARQPSTFGVSAHTTYS